MLNISLALDHKFFTLVFENNSVGVLLDLNQYNYYALTEDMKLIDIIYQPPSFVVMGEKMKVLIDPTVTIYRLPKEQMGPCPFCHTNDSIPVDKLEFFSTNQPSYSKYCTLWKPTMRPAIADGDRLVDLYSGVFRGTPTRINKNRIQNFKGSEILYNILTTLEIEERLTVTLSNVSVVIRSNLEQLLNEDNARWVSPWTQNKTTQYLFLDGDNVACSDLATLKRNSNYNADTVPWLAVLNPEHGSVVINFNEKVYESKLTLLKDLFPDFKTIEISRDKAETVLKTLAVAKSYTETVKELATELMGDAKSIQAIVHGEKGDIFEVGRIRQEVVDNLYIRAAIALIPDEEERVKLGAEVVALLHGTMNGFDY